MPASLHRELFEQVQLLLLPEMDTVDARKACLLPSLNTHPLYSDIAWEGTAREFTTRLIRLLPSDALQKILRHLKTGQERTALAQEVCTKLQKHQESLNAPFLTTGNLLQNARISHQRLIKNLLMVRRQDGLFPSRVRDVSASATVSSIAALAISESPQGLKAAQKTIEKLIDTRVADGLDAGAWRAQAGEVFHTLATAWPLFTIARIFPNRLLDLQNAIGWLTKRARKERSGWGFHRNGDVDPFPTAYALNALLAIQASDAGRSLPPLIQDDLAAAIADGLLHLWQVSAKRDNRWIYWFGESNEENKVCLATTLICFHVFCRNPTAVTTVGLQTENIRESIDRMMLAISEAIVRSGMDVPDFSILLTDGTDLSASVWPERHVTDGINYTYAYFTPLIATTIVELCKEDRFKKDLPVFRKACATLIDWIIKNEKDGLLGRPGQGPSVWAAAQAALVLGRIINSAEALTYYEPLESCRLSQL